MLGLVIERWHVSELSVVYFLGDALRRDLLLNFHLLPQTVSLFSDCSARTLLLSGFSQSERTHGLNNVKTQRAYFLTSYRSSTGGQEFSHKLSALLDLAQVYPALIKWLTTMSRHLHQQCSQVYTLQPTCADQ